MQLPHCSTIQLYIRRRVYSAQFDEQGSPLVAICPDNKMFGARLSVPRLSAHPLFRGLVRRRILQRHFTAVCVCRHLANGSELSRIDDSAAVGAIKVTASWENAGQGHDINWEETYCTELGRHCMAPWICIVYRRRRNSAAAIYSD